MIKKITDINKYIAADNSQKLISSAENFHSNQYNEIINMLINDKKNCRLVCIAGPSSSGKTIFSNKLRQKLYDIGVSSFVMSMDNYFCDKDKIPAVENGKYDFETIDAVETGLFNRQLEDLLKERSIFLPKYNFSTGLKEYDTDVTRLSKNSMIFVEGIHALNYNKLYSNINRDNIFGIYISTQDSYLASDGSIIEPHQVRFIRRAVRDKSYRNCKLPRTLAMWDSVRNGELKYILPYKENADYYFNSSIKYELPILKEFIINDYELMGNNDKRLFNSYFNKKTLEEFIGIKAELVPQASILNEFIPKTF